MSNQGKENVYVEWLSGPQILAKLQEFKGYIWIAIALILFGGIPSYYLNYTSAEDLLLGVQVSPWLNTLLSFCIASAAYSLLWLANLRLYKAKLENNNPNRIKQILLLSFLVLFNANGLGVRLDKVNSHIGQNSAEYTGAKEEIATNNGLIESYSSQLENYTGAVADNAQSRKETDVYYKGGNEKVAGTLESDQNIFSDAASIRQEIGRLQARNARLSSDIIAPIDSGEQILVGGFFARILGHWFIWYFVVTIIVAFLSAFFDYTHNSGAQMVAPAFMVVHRSQEGNLHLDGHLETLIKQQIEKVKVLSPGGGGKDGGPKSPTPKESKNGNGAALNGDGSTVITRYETRVIEKDNLKKANKVKRSIKDLRDSLMAKYIRETDLNNADIAREITTKHKIGCDRSTVSKFRAGVSKNITPTDDPEEKPRSQFGRN